MSSEVILAGCTPEPLLNYLKSLGILRLVSEQVDGQARARWHNERLVLRSSLTDDALVDFLTATYAPTPIIGPWAGGSGFFAKDNTAAVEAIIASSTPRLARLRNAIGAARHVLAEAGLTGKPTSADKAPLLRLMRSHLPDDALLWLDAAWVLGDDGQVPAPLLGTGGNDGRFDFARNFLERLVELGFTKMVGDEAWVSLAAALFDQPTRGRMRCPAGQFNPGAAGGANATVGTEGFSLLNPWDWVLGLEGSLLFAGAACRRYAVGGDAGRATFPFTVRAATVGDAATSEVEASSARGEVWLPLWRRWATLGEVRTLVAEGRLTAGRRQAQDGVESARAVATLGVQRGVESFSRVGFLKRFGKNYLASPMGRFSVRRERALGLLQSRDLDRWLVRYRHEAGSSTRYGSALRQLDRAVLAAARLSGPRQTANLLAAIGVAERQLALSSPPGRIAGDRTLAPCPPLPTEWAQLADDGSAEYRLAAALAGVGADTEIPLRASLEPVVVQGKRVSWNRSTGGALLGRARSVTPLLARILERRLLELGLDGLRASTAAAPTDIALYLAGSVDEHRLVDLLWGLCLVDPRSARRQPPGPAGEEVPPIPRVWIVLKLLLAADQPTESARAESPRTSAGRSSLCRAVLALVRAGSVDQALRLATRRLRAEDQRIVPGRTAGGRERILEPLAAPPTERLAASLLLPVTARDLERLAATVRLEEKTEEAE